MKINHVLGEITGEIHETIDDFRYTWNYKSQIPNYQKVGINCRHFGN